MLARSSRPLRRTTARAVAILALAAARSAAAQDGPLADSPLFEKQAAFGNIAVLYSDTNGPTSESALRQASFDFVPPDESGLNAGLLVQNDAQLDQRDGLVNGFFGDREIDSAAADFNGDGFVDWAAVWQRQNEQIRVAIPQDLSRQGTTDPFTGLPTLAWTQLATLDLQSAGYPPTQPGWDSERPLRTRTATGNFDADPDSEFVVAYWNDQGNVQLVVIDTNGTLVPQAVAAIDDHPLPTPAGSAGSLPANYVATRSTVFDVAAGDLDGDGVDEIALVGVEGRGNGLTNWTLRARVYRHQPGNPLLAVAAVSGDLFTPFVACGAANNDCEHAEWLVAEAGDVDVASPGEEIVVGMRLDRETVLSAQSARDHLMTLRWNSVTGAVVPLVPATTIVHADVSDYWPLALATGDLDGDDIAEIVYPDGGTVNAQFQRVGGSLDVFRTTSSGTLNSGTFQLVASVPQGGGGGWVEDNANANAGPLHAKLLVADLDPAPDGGFSPPEIVSGSFLTGPSFDNPIFLQVFGVTASGPGGTLDVDLLAEGADDRVGAGNAPNVFALTAGLYNGPDVRLGQPTRSSRTSITAPLVVLSAPPLHFDVFGSEILDVNDCFPNVPLCDFVSTYEKMEVQNTFVTTEFHSDWALSATIEGGVDFVFGSVEASLKGTYGEGFSKKSSERRVETLSVVQRANTDDWLYAATLTYDVWEYPIYVAGRAAPSGYVAVIRPAFEDANGIQLAWFNSKSWLAQSFQPDHEVGNVLSYRDIAVPEQAAGFEEEVRWSTSDLRTLAATGSGSWSLGSEDVTAVNTTNSARVRLEASLASEGKFPFSAGIFGPAEASVRTEVAGDYSEESLSTIETSFEQSVGLNFEFGALDPGVGQTSYGVIPYAYWTNTGALVLSYAARPELAQPGFPQTFWQQRYGGGPDPTFILPWRHDPAKGINLGSDPQEVEAKRRQTRDLRFVPDDPLPGETVTVHARVQNYSLLPSPSAELHFYLGDPAQGGQRIFPDSAGPILTGVIPARSSAVTSFAWTIPQGVPIATARVYAVIDPGNAIAGEIHEDNNVAWNALSIPAPEPGGALAAAVAFAALGRRARRARLSV